ncbi:MAG: hypothetical protein AAED33_01550 [Paracoccaceae bacterium]
MVRRADAVTPLKAMSATEVLVTTASDFSDQFAVASRALKPRVFLDAVSDQICETVFTLMPNNARWVSYGNWEPKHRG